MFPFFKLLFKDKAELFLDFRQAAPYMNEKELKDLYRETAQCNLLKETDLNIECLRIIPKKVVGMTVLDVGGGRGVLAKSLAKKYKVKACDIVLSSCDDADQIEWREGNVENLPYIDNEVDTVVCTHVLEHVKDIERAMQELRRVASRCIIIVVPRERPYRFAFNLHLSFFPYEFSVLTVLAKNISPTHFSVENIAGDWLYIENLIDVTSSFHE